MTPPDARPRPHTNWLQRLRGQRRGAVVVGTVATAAILASIAFAVVNGSRNQSGEPPASVAPSSNPASQTAGPSALPSSTPAPTPIPTNPPITATSADFTLLPAQPHPDYAGSIQCSGQIGPSDPVALVTLQTARYLSPSETVLRDYSDVGNPRTVCTLVGVDAWSADLIDARHLLINVPGGPSQAYAVVDLPEVEYHWFRLPAQSGGSGWLSAVSPGLDEVAWVNWAPPTTAGQERTLHLTTAAGDQAVASLPSATGGRCGSPEDSRAGGYTYDGNYLYVLDQLTQRDNTLVVLRDAEQVHSLMPPEGGWTGSGYPAWAVWSPRSDALFYRQGNDVWRWTPTSGAEMFLPAVAWRHPSITSDGRYLAYEVPRADGLHDVYLVDLVDGGDPRQIGAARSRPVFLNDTQLWYMAEDTLQGCVTDQDPRELIYNLRDSSEALSVIHSVWSVWPATNALP